MRNTDFSRRRQAGLAVPVMLIMLGVMLVSSIYLLRSSNSSTLTTANLAYETSLAKAADLGIHTGYQWLVAQPRNVLWNHVPASGYVATTNPTPGKGANDAEFWLGSTKLTDKGGNTVEYVIHRLCTFEGPHYQMTPLNSCALSASKGKGSGKIGNSAAADAPAIADPPQLTYVITSRISGARGGNVMNQAVVMMGP